MSSPAKLCPICKKKPAVAPYTPFCCKRCADVDLGRWLMGSYVVEGQEQPKDEDDGVSEPDLDV